MAAPLRGLPHPLTSLPAPPQSTSTHQLGPLGPPPPATPHWQSSQNVEAKTKDWFLAKAEEDKRKQEEEKTKQGELKLEQRKIERSMLQESLQGGVPPHLVPLIFAGIGGGNVSNWTMDLIQQYAAQLQVSQQQQAQQHQGQQHGIPRAQSPTSRRPIESGTYALGPALHQTAGPPSSVLPGQPLQGQLHQGVFSVAYPGGTASPGTRSGHPPGHGVAAMSAPPPPPTSQLPRLTTNEMSIQPPPTAPSSAQQAQSSQPQQEESSLYFYHWVPPSSQQEKSSSGNAPATPSGKYKASASFPPRARAATDASDSHYTSSPKKRKAEGGHQAPPAPTSAPQTHTSPSYSQMSSSSTSTPQRGHARGHSDASTRGDSLRGALNKPGAGYGQEYGERSGSYTSAPEQKHHRGSLDAESQYHGQHHPSNEPHRYERHEDWHQRQQHHHHHHQRPGLPSPTSHHTGQAHSSSSRQSPSHNQESAHPPKREEGRQ